MLLIYTNRITKRVNYIFKLFFQDVIRVPYIVSTDKAVFDAHQGPKIVYGLQSENHSLFFGSAKLLFENGLASQELNTVEYKNMQLPFPVYQKNTVFPFDVFAAAFYFVSRYEEYMPYRKDLHGRYTAHESYAYKHGFLHKPVINIWAKEIVKQIKHVYPEFESNFQKFTYIPTYDVDQAWSYYQKGITRNVGGMLRNIWNFNISLIAQRIRVLLGKERDPFDTFDYQYALQKKYKLKPIYFILFAQQGPLDKGISPSNNTFKRLIKTLADRAKIGIHLSYESNTNTDLVKTESSALEDVVKVEITRSRQHYLKLHLPETYRNIVAVDLMEDYTMGYAAEPGFRAGICTPFYFYDLDYETETKLKIFPFAVMDGTLRDYKDVGIEEAKAIIQSLIYEVKAVNGTFISLWHNESLSDQDKWKGWREVYTYLLSKMHAR
ncbi:MAG: polysaccharide deacetylase family protein [Bacteroidales bacterium]|nr:polysaccharide deacetylase family protein [Bacteroidales bacterium]